MPMRRAFDPTNPLAVIIATLCAAVAVWDIANVLSFSLSGGPWDALEDPVLTLSTINEYEARSMRDTSVSVLDPLTEIDFAKSAKVARQDWDNLRDEGIELQVIDDGIEIDACRDAAIAHFDANEKIEQLPHLSRIALWVGAVASWASMCFGLCWIVFIFWRRVSATLPRSPSIVSMPVAGAWYGLIVFLYAFMALDAVMWHGVIIALPDWWIAHIDGASMILAIPVITGVAWLLCARPNGSFLHAMGFVSRLNQLSVRATLAMIVGVIGLAGLVLWGLSLIFPEDSGANLWWESLDEKLIFGSPLSATLTSLDAVVGAPVVEEILFRALLFGGLYGAWGFWRAALVSSVIFASVHGYGLEGSIQVAMIGMLLCWIYARTGRLWAPMLAHGILNSLVLLLQFALRELATSLAARGN